MEIKRDIYLNKLISKQHNGLVKVVTGVRRGGKSYLLFNLFRDYLAGEHIADDGKNVHDDHVHIAAEVIDADGIGDRAAQLHDRNHRDQKNP